MTNPAPNPSQPIPLRVLVVEDSEFDARIMVNELRMGGYQPDFKRVETAETMRVTLATQPWDIILADYNLPSFSAPEALKLTQDLRLDIPFIVISGGIGEDIAVECMRAGANDYLMKGNLARLVPAVQRELRDAQVRAARHQAEQQVRESELRYRLLWETCPDAVLLMDANGYIQFANPAVETVFGYQPTEVLGRNISLLQPVELRETHKAGMTGYVKTGRKTADWVARETMGLRKDGQTIIIEVSASDMLLKDQRRFVGFIRDITARKKAEEALRARDQEMQVARDIQQILFPAGAPQLPGFDIGGASFPADATGGDYFDYLPMPDGGMGLTVADVTGHGFGPAMLMAETRAYLRILTQNRSILGDILTLANRTVSQDVGDDRFITLLLAKIDPATRTLVYGSAGHPAGLLLDSSGQVKFTLCSKGPPLGMCPTVTYQASESVPLAPGDLLVLTTDGVHEAAAKDGTQFGTARTLEYLRSNRHRSAAEIVHGLYETVRQFAQGAPQADDVTAVIVKVLG